MPQILASKKWLSRANTFQSARLNTRMYNVQMPRGLVDANSSLEKGLVADWIGLILSIRLLWEIVRP
jgi:hypothetical protein